MSKKKTIKYKQYSFRLNENTLSGLKKIKKKTGLSWNLLFYNYLIKNMGILDFVPRKELVPGKVQGDIKLKCDRCGSEFMGFTWMVKKKEVICQRCWRYDRLDEEENEKN